MSSQFVDVRNEDQKVWLVKLPKHMYQEYSNAVVAGEVPNGPIGTIEVVSSTASNGQTKVTLF